MKNKKKGTYRNDYTVFGLVLSTVIRVLLFICAFLILGYTASCEVGLMSPHDYILKSVPCMAIIYACVYLYDKVFGKESK